MRIVKLLFLLFGFLLLAFVLQQADLEQIWRQIAKLSVVAIAVIFLIYALYFGADVFSWQHTLETVPRTVSWAGRLYLVRMIGEAYNNITPMGSVGGEPVKAWLLKSKYGVPLADSGASLILSKTASMFSLVIFVFVAVFIALDHPRLLDLHKHWVIGAFCWFVFNIVVLFLMQHLKLSSFTAGKIGRSRFASRLVGLVSGMHEMDEQFERFYGKQRARLWWSMAWAMVNWIFGAAELYAIFYFIGHPITWTEAWLIESMLQLIRVVVFFIPAGLGAQEGTLMYAYAAITGTPTPGIAAALVRRFRELVWICLSLIVGFLLRVQPSDSKQQ